MANTKPSLPSIWDEAGSRLSLDALRGQIDHLFNDFGYGLGLRSAVGNIVGDFIPRTDLTDADKQVVLRVELPGVEPKDVDISVAGRTVVVAGEKKSETEVKNGDGYRSERSFGAFSRSFTLPFVIDVDKVDATVDKGVLIVTIAKPAEAQEQSRKIKIHG